MSAAHGSLRTRASLSLCKPEPVPVARCLRRADRLGGKEEPPPLHAHACREMQAAFERGGEAAARATARRIIEAVVGLADPREVERQQRSGVCERIVSVTSMLTPRDRLHFSG